MRQHLEKIYRQHRQGLFTLALTITRRAESAEDAVQTAFERMSRRESAPPPDDAAAYAFAAVRNAARDELRRNKSRIAANQRLAGQASIYNGTVPPAASLAIEAETQALLRQAVEELPDNQREAVVLRIYGQLSFEQMAAVLDEPLQTIASRYRRALQTLRSRIGRLQ